MSKISSADLLHELYRLQTYKMFAGDDLILVPRKEVEELVFSLVPNDTYFIVVDEEEELSRCLCECSNCKEWTTLYGTGYVPKFCPECGNEIKGIRYSSDLPDTPEESNHD